MNIPFSFTANDPTTTPYLRIFSYTGVPPGDTKYNQLASDLSGAAAFGASAAARLRACGLGQYYDLSAALRGFYVIGFSFTCWWNDANDVQPSISLGLYDNGGGVFYPFYPCHATTVSAGGISRTFGKDESGLYLPASPTLLPTFYIETQGAAPAYAVKLAGDLSIYAPLA